MSGVPIIETDRLRLRGHRPSDLPHSQRLWGDPEVVRYIGGKPFTRQQCWGKILAYAGLWSLHGYGYWLVEDRASGEFLGEVGLGRFKRDAQPPLEDVPEAGWALVPEAQGRGLATEAVTAVLVWADSALSADRTICIIDPRHLGSIRVAEKCGYRESHRLTFQGDALVAYSRARAS